MKNILKSLLAIAFVAMLSGYVHAQSQVRTLPFAVISQNSSSTIASTGVFQSIWTANSASPNNKQRAGCSIQNNGTHVMYVFFGPIASATTSNSFQIGAGQTIYCNNNPIILQDQVSITGTTGDAFVAAQQ